MREIAHIRLPKRFLMLHCNARIVGSSLKIYAHHRCAMQRIVGT
jgi:hypothetical protein